MHPIRVLIGTSVLLLLPATSLRGQESRSLRAPAEFAIDQWTTEHGLPQNSVNAIVQTADGYLWIGTFGGLARFDGSGFTMVERNDSTGRHVDRILSLAAAPDGALWIGTENGLLRRQGNDYRLYTRADGLPDDEIRTLHVDAAGVVWIGTGAGGLAWLEGGAIGSLREVGGAELGEVVSIVEDSARTLRVNTGRGVLTIPGGDVSAPSWWRRSPGVATDVLLRDRSGAYWLGGPEGTVRVIGPSARSFRVPGGSIMVEDPGGGYWVGTINDGIFHFRVEADTARVQRYSLPDGRAGFRVRSALVDSDGHIWLGTNANGLLRARRNVFTTYTAEHGLSHNVATAVFADAGGTTWVGTNCGGVNAIDAARGSVRISNPRSQRDPDGDPCVFALAQDARGNMWQGSYGGGVSRLPRATGTPQHSVSGLPDSVVLALLTTRDGTMWVGTRGGGIAAVEDGVVRATYSSRDGLVHNSVRTLYETRDGALWIGTIEGLSRFRDGRFTSYTAADGLSTGHVRSLYEDSDGVLWIGTYGGGLNRFAGGRFTPITEQDGLPDDVVSVILEDDAGNFWMSGNRGIYRVAKRDLSAFADGRMDRVHSVLYGRADGLRNPETNGGFQPAGWKDARGHLWFPTVEGVAVVDPARSLSGGRPPTALLEEIMVDGVAHAPTDDIVIGPGRPNLEFRYSGLSLAAPEHVSFRYRLEGFDPEWVNAGTRRVAYYPRMPAGRYRFVVRAANREGQWGSEVGLRMRVRGPFWNAWWFRAGAAACVLLLAVILMRRRDAGARAERAAKEEFSRLLIESQEHERRRLAGELHDGLGQELLIVRNRALLALRSDDMAAVRGQLDQIADLVGGSLDGIRELAHNLTPHQLDHLGISAALLAMVDALSETAGIELDTRIEEIDGLLPPQSEINLYRIVQEGLNNVVRHSGARTAALHVRREGSTVRVTLIDHGRGFQTQRDARGRPTGGFGLSGMAERTRILGGLLDVVSAPGRGTRVELVVPVMRRPADAHHVLKSRVEV